MLIDKMMPILEQLSDLLVTRIVLRAVVDVPTDTADQARSTGRSDST